MGRSRSVCCLFFSLIIAVLPFGQSFETPEKSEILYLWNDTKIWTVDSTTPSDWLPTDEGFLDIPKATRSPSKVAPPKPTASKGKNVPPKPTVKSKGQTPKQSKVVTFKPTYRSETTNEAVTRRRRQVANQSSDEMAVSTRRRLLSIQLNELNTSFKQVGSTFNDRRDFSSSNVGDKSKSNVLMQSMSALQEAFLRQRNINGFPTYEVQQRPLNTHTSSHNHTHSTNGYQNGDHYNQDWRKYTTNFIPDVVGDLHDVDGSGEGSGAGQDWAEPYHSYVPFGLP